MKKHKSDRVKQILSEFQGNSGSKFNIQINSEKTIIVNGDYSENKQLDQARAIIKKALGG